LVLGLIRDNHGRTENRRIHKEYFRDDFRTVISALGYLWEGGKINLYLRVKSLPGDNPNPPSGPILDPTAVEKQFGSSQLRAINEQALVSL